MAFASPMPCQATHTADLVDNASVLDENILYEPDDVPAEQRGELAQRFFSSIDGSAIARNEADGGFSLNGAFEYNGSAGAHF